MNIPDKFYRQLGSAATENFVMRAVIFDMDGVLVDSELHWKRVEETFLQRFIPRWSKRDQQQIIGMSIHDVYSALVKNYDLTLSKEEFLAGYDALALDIYGVQSSLLPGAAELLESLASANRILALASSSPRNWIDILIRRFSLDHLFVHVASGDDVPGRGKPEPDIYLITVATLGCTPQECVAIEDSGKGVKSAKRAGLFCVGLRNGFNEEQDLSEADIVVDKLASLSGLSCKDNKLVL